MRKIVFLLEESSMKEFLDVFLPRLLPPGIEFKTIPHEGKQDLEKSIPRKLRAWRETGVRFIIVRNLDGANYLRVKEELCRICMKAGRRDSLVRIACNELESWFLGDLTAVALAFNKPSISPVTKKSKVSQSRRSNQCGTRAKKDCTRLSKTKRGKDDCPTYRYDKKLFK